MHSETDLAVVPLLNLCPPGATEAIAVDVNGVDQLDEQGKETEDEGGNAEKAAGYVSLFRHLLSLVIFPSSTNTHSLLSSRGHMWAWQHFPLLLRRLDLRACDLA